MARQGTNGPRTFDPRQPTRSTGNRRRNWRSKLNYFCSRKKRAPPAPGEQFVFLGSGMLILLFPILFTYWPGGYLFQNVGILYPYLAHFNYIGAVCCFILTSFNDPGNFLARFQKLNPIKALPLNPKTLNRLMSAMRWLL
jgi:hypothetical protein